MRIIIFTHPTFLNHQSMPRFSKMLEEGMRERGHMVEVWSPKPRFSRISEFFLIKKWLGYIDQFIIFPIEFKRKIKKKSENTLYVFSDQALGPWVPLVANKSHVIHCHDFIAQRSAMGEIPEVFVGWSGKYYQEMIRKGYSRGKNFISVSQKTKKDLHRFLPVTPSISKVVYNGFNQNFFPQDPDITRKTLKRQFGLNLSNGYVLHVGGNQWYKNRVEVIAVYNSWRALFKGKIPLLLVGQPPDKQLSQQHERSQFRHDIHFLPNLSDQLVQKAYSGASLLLFPSLEEGFGWPIAEAMASGCPVITTGEAPMTEVGGEAAFYVLRRPTNPADLGKWQEDVARMIQKVIVLDSSEREKIKESGFQNSKRFDTHLALNRIESIYKLILEN